MISKKEIQIIVLGILIVLLAFTPTMVSKYITNKNNTYVIKVKLKESEYMKDHKDELNIWDFTRLVSDSLQSNKERIFKYKKNEDKKNEIILNDEKFKGKVRIINMDIRKYEENYSLYFKIKVKKEDEKKYIESIKNAQSIYVELYVALGKQIPKSVIIKNKDGKVKKFKLEVNEREDRWYF